MDTTVEFESSLFSPFLPDDCQVNPGRYGAELAFWLSKKLAEAQIFTSYPNFEDWGWFIEYINESGEEFWLCCANVDGSNTKWMCRFEAKGKGVFGRKKPLIEKARQLVDAVKSILHSEPEIKNVNWNS
jgi:hypothetical protein